MFIRSILQATVLIAATAVPLMAGDLTVQVDAIRSGEGTIRIALHDGPDGFPGEREPIAVQSVAAQTGSVRIIFAGLPPGEYATTLFHDENNDGELAVNIVGMPTEGLAFSNDATGSFGPASFEDASFAMPSGNLAIITTVSY